MSQEVKMERIGYYETSAGGLVIIYEATSSGLLNNFYLVSFDDTIIISFRSKKVIKSRLHTSRSGHHGTRQYVLLPAKYLKYAVHRSNLGNTYIYVKIIDVNENGETILQEWPLYEGKEQKMQLTQLPENIRALLESNKDQLSLFYYILNQDQAE